MLNIEILVALPDGERGGARQEFVAEDLGHEDVGCHILRLELVAADSGIGAAEVARFPGKVALAEGDLYLVIEGVLGADMSALGIGIGTDGAEGARKRPGCALARSERELGRARSLSPAPVGFLAGPQR